MTLSKIRTIIWSRPAFASFFIGPLVFVAAYRPIRGEETARDSSSAGKSEFVVLPVVYRMPETGWAGGLAGQIAFRPPRAESARRPSSIQFAAIGTENKQVVFTAKPEIYFGREDYAIAGSFEISRYPDFFFGIGSHTTESMKEGFTPRQMRLEVRGLRRIGLGTPIYAGIVAVAETYRFSAFAEGGALARGDVQGSAGGTLAGLGLALRLDTRDNVFIPQRGRLWEFSAVRFASGLGGDYSFAKFKADLRSYVPLSSGQSLALEARFEAASGSAVPFMALPKVGGDSLLRGYYNGRFRDRVMASLQAECRIALGGRFGAVLFTGFGQVAGDMARLGLGEFLPSVGAGLRFRVSEEGTNIRVDAGWGRGTQGIYFTAGEAF